MLKEKYGIQKLNKVANLFGANIPERYWFNEYDEYENHITDVMDGLKNGKDFFIACNDIYVSNLFVATILKKFINQGVDCIRYNYSEIISKFSDKIGLFNLDSFMNDVNDSGYIAITDVMVGKYYTNTSHHFENILTNIINSRIEKRLIIVVNELSKIEKSIYREHYGDLVCNLMFSEKFEIISNIS
jgi:hypothetical protein